MARDIVYMDQSLWETSNLLYDENFGNSNLGHGNQEKNVAVVGDQISSLIGPNIMISNENRMAQPLESTGLIGDVVVGLHGSQEKNVGRLEIMSSSVLGLNNTTSNENQRAQQLGAGLIWDGMQVGHVHQEIKNVGYEMLSLGPNTTCIENQMQRQQQLNVLGSIGGTADVGNIMLPHGGRQNEDEGHFVVQKRKGKEIVDPENENDQAGRHVVPQKRKGKEIVDQNDQGRQVVSLERKGKEIMADIDLENVGKEKEKKKRKNTNRQELASAARVRMEQERRRKEAQLFADLRAMHPKLHPKAAKFRVIEETMSSIESLKQTLESLEKQKLEMMLGSFTNTSTVEPLIKPSQGPAATNKEAPLLSSMNSNTISAGTSLNTFNTWVLPNVTLSVSGTRAVISICSLKRHGLFTTICLILKNHNLDVVSAEIFSDDGCKTMYMIHVRVHVPPEFTEGFPYEQLYKNAVNQIKFCLDL